MTLTATAEPDLSSHVSVARALYDRIKENILSGRYRPGAVLRQEDLAQQFSVSRVPLREAFSKLEAEGLLSLRPRRGYSVISLNPDEIAEIFDLRMLIEAHAGQVATKNQTREDIDEVNALLARMLGLDPDAATYFTEWCSLNRAFHERLIRSCKRPFQLKLCLQLRDRVEPYIRLETLMTGHAREADVDHREIAAAFARGQAELVGHLSAAHVGRTAARLLNAIGAKPETR